MIGVSVVGELGQVAMDLVVPLELAVARQQLDRHAGELLRHRRDVEHGRRHDRDRVLELGAAVAALVEDLAVAHHHDRGAGRVPVVPLGEHRVDATANVASAATRSAATSRAPPELPPVPRMPRAPRSRATSRTLRSRVATGASAPPPSSSRRARAVPVELDLDPGAASRCGPREWRARRPPSSESRTWRAAPAPPGRWSLRSIDQARAGGKPRTEHLAAEVAGGDARAVGVAQPLHLAGVAGGEEVVAAGVLGEPHRGLDRRAALAEGREAEIAGAVQRVGHRREL